MASSLVRKRTKKEPVERTLLLREQGVAGSNPVIPTISHMRATFPGSLLLFVLRAYSSPNVKIYVNLERIKHKRPFSGPGTCLRDISGTYSGGNLFFCFQWILIFQYKQELSTLSTLNGVSRDHSPEGDKCKAVAGSRRF